MTTNMVLNTGKGITIKIGVGCVNKMNDTVPYLPCLKHKEGGPLAMTMMNINYT